MGADPSRGAPAPKGPLSGKRSSWRRKLGLALSRVNGWIAPTPVGRALRRRLADALVVSQHEVELARGGAGLDGLRIAFLSDVHAGNVLMSDDVVAVFERVAAEEPDLVALGGDLINVRAREMEAFEHALPLVTPPLGTVAVPGNHEHYRPGEVEPWREWLEARGVTVLTNRGVRVERAGASLLVAGVDDRTEGERDLDAALATRRADEPTLLLAHHPDDFAAASAAGVDLQLSGHTHGGQIRLFGRAPIRHSKLGYEMGRFERDGATLIVGCGVGVTAMPFRLGVAPEIVVVTLRRR